MRKFLIIIDGPMGSGKTTVAQMLHKKLKRTAHIGLDRIKWFISDFKRIPQDNEIVRSVVAAMMKEYLKHNISVIVEQGMRKERIEVLKRAAKKSGARYFAYQLDAPKPLLFKRIRERPKLSDRPRVSRARIERNYRAYQESHKNPIATVLNAEKLSAKEITNHILRDLKK
jgi:adenylate kinase family enzyme